MWTGAVTNTGVMLLKTWAAGGTLVVTGAQGASGYVNEGTLVNQAALMSPMQDLSIVSYKLTDAGVRYKIQIGPHSSEYTIRQIGLFARLNDGQNTLIAIFQDRNGMTVPSKADMPNYVFSFYGTIQMSNQGELSVVVDAEAFVTQSTMQEYVAEALAGLDFTTYDNHIASRKNPHGVTAQQLGLAKVATSGKYADLSGTPQVQDEVTAGGENPVSGDAVYEHVRGYTYDKNTLDNKIANAGSKVTVDNALSGTSANPVENRVVKAALDGKAPKSHNHYYAGSQEQGGAANSAKKVENKLTIRLGGEEKAAFDGSQAAEINVTPTSIGAAEKSHNQAASTITAGTLGGQVNANAAATAAVGTAQVRDIRASTTDLTEGTSPLASGEIYLVF